MTKGCGTTLNINREVRMDSCQWLYDKPTIMHMPIVMLVSLNFSSGWSKQRRHYSELLLE